MRETVADIKVRATAHDVETGEELVWVVVSTAARMLKVSRQRVYQLCRAGELRSRVYDGRRYVATASVGDRLGRMLREEVDRYAHR